jgi:hypothetical protein
MALEPSWRVRLARAVAGGVTVNGATDACGAYETTVRRTLREWVAQGLAVVSRITTDASKVADVWTAADGVDIVAVVEAEWEASPQAQAIREGIAATERAREAMLADWTRIRDAFLRTVGTDQLATVGDVLSGCDSLSEALAVGWPSGFGSMRRRLGSFVETWRAVERQREARAKLAAMPHRPSSGWGVGWAEGGMLPRDVAVPTVPRASVAKRATWGDR